jgi:signal peptidase I
MQPTLMGSPEAGVYDRVLVDKLSMHFRDPQRFEIVVFKHPLERSRIMVKRVVGMPGEQFKIDLGDLWTRPDDETPWTVLRRPGSVQREMWRALDLERPKRTKWSVERGGDRWRISGRDVVAHGSGTLRFEANQGHVRDAYLDGYPDALADEIHGVHPRWLHGEANVGDLRLEGEVEALPGLETVSFVLTEGARTSTFTLPGPKAPEDARPAIRVRDPERGAASDDRVPDGVLEVLGEPWRLASGRSVRFAAQNLDDRLALEIDGDEVAALEIEPSRRQEAVVSVEVAGEGAELADLMPYRDIYYLPLDGQVWEQTIPEGSYVMLGDNTRDSADSRDWNTATFSYPGADGSEVRARGNHRSGGENPADATGPDGEALRRFRDEWGELHWFPREAGGQTRFGPSPFVSRELVVGRAVAVFWPLKPHKGLWRLAWLH